ncbi:putative quinol monooxygenase [Pseudonocardia ailaonensis]|uniref:Quinol monooxygenase n=1 Tax=Pseudonocardia ailaonensis TaxID=367279 RepID=A0ABN2NCN3_9PSEU
MSPVIVIATISPAPGHEQAVRDVLLEAIPKVHAEPGCVQYALHEAIGDSTDLVFVEKWESIDALRVHGKAPALAEAGPKLADKLAKPMDVRRLTAIPAGTPEQGEI